MSELTKEEIQQMREAALTYPYDYAIGDMFPRRVIGLCDLALSALDRTWRPIETAPKDGTEIIGLDDCMHQAVCWCYDKERGLYEGFGGFPWFPEYWQPLPEPPKENP